MSSGGGYGGSLDGAGVAGYNTGFYWFRVFNATLNNFSAISWQSVFLVEETGVPENTHGP